MLEKEKEEPKSALEPAEESKLSGDMRELYDRLLPSPESDIRRKTLVKKLERILREEWPGNEFKVHVFGSSGNLLCTSESDVDICIQTPMKKLETVHMLAEALAKHGMERVVCVPSAKVPIVKIWDPELRLACDMNVNNTLALENTRMIKTYVQIDERVRPLAMIIKYWTSRRILNDAALGGTLSSYTWICMILNFLQTREPPILPALHQIPDHRSVDSSGHRSDFADDLDVLRGYGNANTETIGQLLFHFFRRYGHEIDYGKFVVSVRHGRLLTREEKGWDINSLTKEGRNRICVEEPFNTSRNLGNSADEFASRGIHLELRRAFSLLADGGQLDACCEQFEFPPLEKTTFIKPAQAPKPVLLQSDLPARAGRTGGGSKGGRSSFNQKNSHGFRRASSGASFGNPRYTNPPYSNPQSPPISVLGPEYFARGDIHNQLYQQYQFLERQKAHLLAHTSAQMQAHAHAQVASQTLPRHSSTANGSPQKTPYLNGHAGLHAIDNPPATAPIVPGFLYHYPTFLEEQPMSESSSNEGARTNPSSPSIAASVPALRRVPHRSSVATGSPSASIRSQSQPARTLVGHYVAQGYPPVPVYDPPLVAGYPMAGSSPEYHASQGSLDMAHNATPGYHVANTVGDYGMPREYVGYLIDNSPRVRPQYHQFAVPQIPPYRDLAARRQRLSPDRGQSGMTGSSRRVSRSPSPLGHSRNYTTGIPSVPLPPPPLPRSDRADSIQAKQPQGLAIANGSSPWVSAHSRDIGGTNGVFDVLTPDDSASHSSVRSMHENPRGLDPLSPRQQPPLNMDALHRQTPLQAASDAANDYSPAHAAQSDLVSLLEHQERFPALPETILAGVSSGPEDDDPQYQESLSPKSRHPQGWSTDSSREMSTSPLDHSKKSVGVSTDSPLTSVPLLSPVYEMRTPPSTANRNLEGSKGYPMNGFDWSGNVPNGIENMPPPPVPLKGEETTPQVSQPKKDMPSTGDKPSKGNAPGNSHSNSWEKAKAGRKNGRKRASSGANKGAAEIKPRGQPMPANEADRKGG